MTPQTPSLGITCLRCEGDGRLCAGIPFQTAPEAVPSGPRPPPASVVPETLRRSREPLPLLPRTAATEAAGARQLPALSASVAAAAFPAGSIKWPPGAAASAAPDASPSACRRITGARCRAASRD